MCFLRERLVSTATDRPTSIVSSSRQEGASVVKAIRQLLKELPGSLCSCRPA